MISWVTSFVIGVKLHGRHEAQSAIIDKSPMTCT